MISFCKPNDVKFSCIPMDVCGWVSGCMYAYVSISISMEKCAER